MKFVLGLLTTCLLVKFSHSASRIIGGSNASPGMFPYQVLMLRTRSDRNFVYSSYCGGSILNHRFIITATHCLDDEGHNDWKTTIKVGKLLYSEDDEWTQTFGVSRIFIHPNNQGVKDHPEDIAIVKVDRNIQFNQRVKAVTLPRAGSHPTGHAWVSGWGDTNSNPNISVRAEHLQYAYLPLVSPSDCRKAWGINERQFEETTICTGPINFNKRNQDACGGDSGGPLVQKSGQSFILVGVVSWGASDCGNGLPGAYARVSHYIHWIQSNSEN